MVCIGNITCLIMGGFFFKDLTSLQSYLLALALTCFYCTNYQCVSHNFIHNNFFKSKLLNDVFSCLNSMAMGLPQTLYYHHHMNHHRFNNDRKNPETGETKDISSLYRFSKDDEVENILSYSFIGFFRIDLIGLAKKAKSPAAKSLLVKETISVLLFWGALITIDWKFFVLFYLPVWYLGQVAALMENYFEHYGSEPGNRKTDSVSCYNSVYNFLWFNNGYHQEHHFSPQTHWTKIKEIREQLPEETERKVVSGAHFFNLPIK